MFRCVRAERNFPNAIRYVDELTGAFNSMSGHYRRSFSALGRCLVIAFAVATSALAQEANRQSRAAANHARDTPASESTPGPQNAQGQPDSACHRRTTPSDVVNTGAQPTETDEDEQLKVDQRIADETDRLADYTWWLAFLTGGLCVVAIGQLAMFYRQWETMKTGLRDTKIAADAALANAEAARTGAEAAKAANQLTEKIFLSTERPWVYADISTAKPLTYDVNGLNFAFVFIVKNIGKSLATRIIIEAKLVAPAIGSEQLNIREISGRGRREGEGEPCWVPGSGPFSEPKFSTTGQLYDRNEGTRTIYKGYRADNTVSCWMHRLSVWFRSQHPSSNVVRDRYL